MLLTNGRYPFDIPIGNVKPYKSVNNKLFRSSLSADKTRKFTEKSFAFQGSKQFLFTFLSVATAIFFWLWFWENWYHIELWKVKGKHSRNFIIFLWSKYHFIFFTYIIYKPSLFTIFLSNYHFPFCRTYSFFCIFVVMVWRFFTSRDKKCTATTWK